mmetsp:Transcript_6516/g.8103  ORF Transcript_6516/g.8103 Transcript_6516/m.8103 type:complete len:114 (-) Transcript_6516:171-512(-)
MSPIYNNRFSFESSSLGPLRRYQGIMTSSLNNGFLSSSLSSHSLLHRKRYQEMMSSPVDNLFSVAPSSLSLLLQHQNMMPSRIPSQSLPPYQSRAPPYLVPVKNGELGNSYKK